MVCRMLCSVRMHDAVVQYGYARICIDAAVSLKVRLRIMRF